MNERQLAEDKDFITIQRKVRDDVGTIFSDIRKQKKVINRIELSPSFANILMVFCYDLIDSNDGMIPKKMYGVNIEINETVNQYRIYFQE